MRERWGRCCGVHLVLLLSVAACGSSGGPARTSGASTRPSAAPSTAPSTAPPVRSLVSAPVGLLAVGDAVWVASSGAGTVVSFDANTGTRRTSVPVGATPLRLASDGHYVWASVFGDGRVVAIDPAKGRVVRRVAVAGQPEGIVAAFGAVWVVRQQSRALSRIDPAGRITATYRVGREPRLVAAGANALFVTDYANGTVTRIDPRDGHATTSGRMCAGAQDLVDLRGTLWVSCTAGDEVVAVDESTLRVKSRIPVPGQPDGLDATGGRLTVVASAGPTLYRLDTEKAAVAQRTNLGPAAPLDDRANDDVVTSAGATWVSSFADGAVLRARD